jgi:hypothetical protein
MALRIGGGRPKPPVEEELPMEEMMAEMPVEEPMPEEMMAEMPAEEPPMEPEPQMGLVDPAIAGYKGPEEGPFACGSCAYYMGDGRCVVLAAPVDEAGLCNLFMASRDAEEEEPMPEMQPEEMVEPEEGLELPVE